MTRKGETFGPGELVNLTPAVAESLIAAGVVEKPRPRSGEPAKPTPKAVAELADDDES